MPTDPTAAGCTDPCIACMTDESHDPAPPPAPNAGAAADHPSIRDTMGPADGQQKMRLLARLHAHTSPVPAPADRARALTLLEAANHLRDAHFQHGMSVQEIGTALRNTADEADPMVGSLARDGFGLDEIAAMLSQPAGRPDCDCEGVVHMDDCEVYAELVRTGQPTAETRQLEPESIEQISNPALPVALTSLAERWEQMADQGDAAIGHFEGPTAVTLNIEVAERGSTYRQAAADVREVLRTGCIPHDLLAGSEPAAPPVPADADLRDRFAGVLAYAEQVAATSGPGPASAVQAVIDRLRAALADEARQADTAGEGR